MSNTGLHYTEDWQPKSATFKRTPTEIQISRLEAALKELDIRQPESGQHKRFLVRMLCLLQNMPYPGPYEIPNSTPMQTLPSDIPVERIPMPESFSSEPDLAHQWATSLQPRFTGLVPVRNNNIRNLQTVLFNVEADRQMRIRAHRQLQINAAQGCEDSTNVLSQWEELGLSLD